MFHIIVQNLFKRNFKTYLAPAAAASPEYWAAAAACPVAAAYPGQSSSAAAYPAAAACQAAAECPAFAAACRVFAADDRARSDHVAVFEAVAGLDCKASKGASRSSEVDRGQL